MADYFPSLWRCFKDLRNNPVLLIPFLLQPLAVILLAVILAAAGLAILFPMMGIGLADFASVAAFIAAFASIVWTPGLIAAIILVALVILLLLALVSAWFTGGSLAMVNDVVEGRKTGSASFYAGARGLFGRLLGYWALSALLYAAAALPMALFILLAIAREQGRVAFILFAVLFGLLFLAAALFLAVALFFGQPVLVREGLGSAAAIARSFGLLRERPRHVILSFLVVIGTSVAVGIAFSILFFPVTLLTQARPESAGIQALNTAASLLQNIVSVILGIVLTLFLFRMHKEGWLAAVGRVKQKK
jgi:hypothetical protein